MSGSFRVLAVSVTALLISNAVAQAQHSPPPPANPRNCENKVPFPRWFEDFQREAQAEGISARTIQSTLGGMTPDPSVIKRDRRQSFFSQTFLQFYGKLATENRYKMGRSYLQKHADWFNKAEAEFGVPGAVITGFWALESDFGVGMGTLPVIRSLLTLAWDCRRGQMFRDELKAALMLIERGELTADEMIGSWAGELGQTQFLPRHYLNHALDYNGNGRRDLMREIPDIIGSTAGFIQSLGWRPGEPWLEEVRLTRELPWDQADLTIELPRAQWANWGVTALNGDLPADQLNASLMLPMGRNGPAFLAYPNFRIYLQWNQSLTYAMTAAHLASRMAGGPPLSRRSDEGIESLDYEQTKQLQTILRQRGFDVGEIDGRIGAGTRAAVKAVQLQLGFPPDSYPTPALLAALRGRS